MGNDECDFQSVFTATIGKTGMHTAPRVEKRKSNNSKTNFQLGIDKDDYNTTYKLQTRSSGNIVSSKYVEPKSKQSVQMTHFALGSDENIFESTSQAN